MMFATNYSNMNRSRKQQSLNLSSTAFLAMGEVVKEEDEDDNLKPSLSKNQLFSP